MFPSCLLLALQVQKNSKHAPSNSNLTGFPDCLPTMKSLSSAAFPENLRATLLSDTISKILVSRPNNYSFKSLLTTKCYFLFSLLPLLAIGASQKGLISSYLTGSYSTNRDTVASKVLCKENTPDFCS